MALQTGIRRCGSPLAFQVSDRHPSGPGHLSFEFSDRHRQPSQSRRFQTRIASPLTWQFHPRAGIAEPTQFSDRRRRASSPAISVFKPARLQLPVTVAWRVLVLSPSRARFPPRDLVAVFTEDFIQVQAAAAALSVISFQWLRHCLLNSPPE